MERRVFVGALLGSGTMAASIARAAAAPAPDAEPISATAIHIAVQNTLPHADALAHDIARALRTGGMACGVHPEYGLPDAARIGQLLGLERAALVVLADEATAIVVQAMAASRAQACLLAMRHRWDNTGSLHSATTELQRDELRWAERPHGRPAVAARLHVQALKPAARTVLDADLARLSDSTAAAAARRWPHAGAGLVSLAIRL